MTGTRSEIDDIFASKSKGTSSAQPVASSSTSGPGSSTLPKKKKKDKKRKLEAIEVDEPLEAPVENPPKRRVPVTVVDASSSSSLSVPPPSKPKSAKKLSTAPLSKPKNKEKDQKELEEFKDSRGTGPRRQTEEGFSIFKEAELGINVEAGGTPLCPFDCDCCF